MKTIFKLFQGAVCFAILVSVFTSCSAGQMKALQNGASFLSLIFGLVLAVALVYTWILKAKDGDNDKTSNEFGCWGVVLIAALIIGLIVFFS